MAKISKDNLHTFFDENINLETRTIYLGYGAEGSDYELDDVMASRVLKSLHLFSSTRREEPVSIIINCQGGDVQHGLAIYDAINNMGCSVVGTVYGHCWSMAVWILQACDTRLASVNSSLMIHDGESEVSGKKKDQQSWIRYEKEQDERCYTILLDRIREKHPTYTRARLKKLLETDTVLWSEQAVELGLLDGVI